MPTWPWEAEPSPKTLLGSQEPTPGHTSLPGHRGSCQETPDFLFPGLEMLRKISLGLSLNHSHCSASARGPSPRTHPTHLRLLPLGFPTPALRVFSAFACRPPPGQVPGNVGSQEGREYQLYGWYLLHPPQPGSHRQYPHFTGRETEARRGKGMCLLSCSWKLAAVGLSLSRLCNLAWKPCP